MLSTYSVGLLIFLVLIKDSNGLTSSHKLVRQEKRGFCPAHSYQIQSCVKICLSDSDCFESQKCCPTACGQRCMLSKQHNPALRSFKEKKNIKYNRDIIDSTNKCPRFVHKLSNSTECQNVASKCLSNNDCKSGKMCCLAECNKKRCVEVNTIKMTSFRSSKDSHYFYDDYHYVSLPFYDNQFLQRRVPPVYGSRLNQVLGYEYGTRRRFDNNNQRSFGGAQSRLPRSNFY